MLTYDAILKIKYLYEEQKRPDLELFASQVTRSEIQYPLYYTKVKLLNLSNINDF